MAFDPVTYAAAKSAAKTYTDTVVSALPKGLVYKGAVQTYAQLPSSGQQIGDCYTVVTESGVTVNKEYAWGVVSDVAQWIQIGSDISMLDIINSQAELQINVTVSGNTISMTLAEMRRAISLYLANRPIYIKYPYGNNIKIKLDLAQCVKRSVGSSSYRYDFVFIGDTQINGGAFKRYVLSVTDRGNTAPSCDLFTKEYHAYSTSTSITSSSTNSENASAKAVYDAIQAALYVEGSDTV